MYSTVLSIHSWFRWAVVVAGLIAIVRAIAGVSARRSWTSADDRAGFWFTLTLDLQMLLGLLLYVALSPITRAAMQDFGGAMSVSSLRFWAVEHAFGMILALALAHAGRARTRRLSDSRARHKVAAICFVLALLAVLISIPWPGMPNGRPLLRGYYFLVIRTPPFEVRTRMSGPPEPSVASICRLVRPLTMTGKSLFRPPLTVAVSSRAE